MAGRIGYYGGIVRDGLVLDLDAAKLDSYPRTGTSWKDISGNQNNGTLTNGPTFDSGNGGSIVFDGVNDSFNTPFTNSGGNNTTSTIWYKWNGINQENILTYLGNGASTGLGFYINGGGNNNTPGNKISILYGGSYYNALDTGTLYGTLVSGIYTHLTLTRDNTTTRLYQDGIFIGSTTRTPNSNTSNLNFVFGTVGGSVSLIQFYNRALSSQEVLQNYNATKTRFGL
jgi:hypothetical protein